MTENTDKQKLQKTNQIEIVKLRKYSNAMNIHKMGPKSRSELVQQ